MEEDRGAQRHLDQYFGIDLAIVWDIVRNKLPLLERQMRAILARAPR